MKSIIALLLGLSAVVFAGKEFEWDSSDADKTRSYDGVVVQVYKPTDGAPTVTLGTSRDSHRNTYCLNFLRTFEAVGYDTTATTATDDQVAAVEVSGSSVNLANANCTVSDVTDSSFKVSCDNVNGGELVLNFNFVDSSSSSTGNNGLEYTIELDGYTWVSSDSAAQLVVVQKVGDCTTEYEYSEHHDDEDDTEEDDTEADTEADTDTTTRRRMEDDTETDTEDEEDDEEDSREYYDGFAQFALNGQAQDQCPEGNTNITSNLVRNDGELHIVFEHFSCNLFIDPEWVVDLARIGGVGKVSVFMAAVSGLLALLF